MRIAEAFGLKVVPSSLIRLASGELGYVTKRIDRTAKGNKIHMLDMFQVTEAYNKYKSSMEKVGKAVLAYSDNTFLDLLNLFELTLFSFITGNNDMHLKNFSMIESEVGWILAPAYDLLNVTILFPEDTEELALPTDAKKKKLRRSHFEQYGLKMGLTKRQVNSTLERVLQNCKKAHEWIDESFLSNEMKDKYRALLDARSERLQPDNSDLTRVT